MHRDTDKNEPEHVNDKEAATNFPLNADIYLNYDKGHFWSKWLEISCVHHEKEL